MGWWFVSLVAFALAAPAPAQETRQQSPAPRDKPEDSIVVEGEKDPKKKMVCRGAVSTGSIIRKQTCITQESWDWREAKDKETAQALKDEQTRRRAAQQLICMARNMVC